MKKKSGAVLIICLLLLSVIVVLIEQLSRGVLVGSYFTRTMIEREQAKSLALNGVRLAMLQVALQANKKDEKDKNQQADQDKDNDAKKEEKRLQKTLLRTLPHVNRWQSFYLKKKYDGLDGQIKVCITAEAGKININEK